MANLRLLETAEFVEELHARLGRARDRAMAQLMTFDGDEAGQAIADRFVACSDRGVEVRLLIDCFVEKGVSDTPAGRPEVSEEFAATNQMYDRLRREGVDVRFTHPTGPLGIYTLVRNHKKIFVIDDTAYLGGINVSDHNFAWRDFMIAIDVPEVVEAIVADFDDTWDGRRRSIRQAVDPEDEASFELITNDEVEDAFDSLVAGARHEVIIASPYADDIGLCRLLARSRAPKRQVICPATSNVWFYRVLAPYIRDRLDRSGVGVASYERFSHAKFLLVDDEALLIGSSNFGRHSFWCNEEICLLITDTAFVAHFKAMMTADISALATKAPLWRLARGAVAAHVLQTGNVVLRRTVAGRVPALSTR